MDSLILESDWQEWLKRSFPSYVTKGFASHHKTFWEWVWSLQKGIRPRPLVAIWARGGAKSSSAELAAATVGIRKQRKYIIYSCETQEQTDKHVATIASLLESAGVERALNKYGSSRGWRRNRLRAASGFTVDALGFDTAQRGVKVDEERPDMIILDDIDARHDSPEQVLKKIETLTTTILPTGSNDCAVLAVQNLIHINSIFSRLADKRAEFLSDRIISGPFKAIDDLTYENINGEFIITGGTPTWEGQNIQDCQGFIKTWGIHAFLRECQHEVAEAEGALWTQAIIDAMRVASVPPQMRIVVGVDPEASSKEGSAETGIVVCGVGPCDCRGGDPEQHLFVLGDASMRGRPNEWAKAAVAAFGTYKADRMVAEANMGGEMVENTIHTVKPVPVTMVHASKNKQARAEPVASLYEQHKAHHVGYLPQLEQQMVTWVPMTGQPSPDRIDALVWAAVELLPGILGGGTSEASVPTQPSRWNINHESPRSGSRWKRNWSR